MSEFHDFGRDGGDVVPLEPLTRSTGRQISRAMRTVFDVLYEADRPLTVDEIAERTYRQVYPAVRYHAKRAYLRDLERQRVSLRQGLSEREIDERHAWRQYIAKLMRNAARRHVVLREGDPYSPEQRYAPNPDRPPRAERPDGTIGPYTRELWANVTAAEETAGEIQVMSMETERVLGGMDINTLRQTVALVARNYIENPVDERGLRGKLLWLMDRPSTDAGRAWLLTELVRRAYGELSA